MTATSLFKTALLVEEGGRVLGFNTEDIVYLNHNM